ncbi:hypothetical protein [Amylibacter sp. IMCC11727]|uniref:hypothetical protein n=1 Tax=Amylibacter sp. IMCC11727 TaxID=3039851 RepID=UPI00244DC748|nr:hypothetical protein [Amylibacter sp. IMCC11727]WGI21970.1 hypothetical protein QBD29_00705 [Amylibacter sp. IMCC11727]
MPLDPALAILQYHVYASNKSKRWKLQSLAEWNEDYQAKKLRSTLKTLDSLDDFDKLKKLYEIGDTRGPNGLSEIFSKYLESLQNDLADCLTPNQRKTLAQTHFSFLDLGDVNAMVTNRSRWNEPLSYNLIFLNEGLYFCIGLLMAAQVYEHLRGDFAQYQKSGREAFEAAVNTCINRDASMLNVTKVSTGDADADGTIEAYIASANTLVMTFCALHEIGHAHLGHLADGHTRSMAAFNGSDEINSSSIQQEFEADEFAMRALAFRSSEPERIWANFFAINLFFGFLNVIEYRTGEDRFSDHPPSAERSAALRKVVESMCPMPAGFDADYNSQKALLETWANPESQKGS